MDKPNERSEGSVTGSNTPTTDALEDLRRVIFGSNPGRGPVRKAVEDAGAELNLVQRAIQPSTLEAIRKVEEELRGE